MISPRRARTYTNVLLVGLLGLALLIPWYQNIHRRIVAETLLRNQLQGLRTAVQLYLLQNKGMPPHLPAALGAATAEGTSLLQDLQLHIASNGDLLDPFGQPFAYDRRSGWVRSSTEKYREW